MPLGVAYQVVKDLIGLAKMEEAEAIDPGTLDAKELVAMGILEGENTEGYSWCAPRNLFAKTGAKTATHDVVWVTDKLRRTKRQVVRNTHDGNIDLILVRKKESK